MSKISRRSALKGIGLVAGASLIASKTSLAQVLPQTDKKKAPVAPPKASPDGLIRQITVSKPVTIITIGAGSRGNAYGSYIYKYPEHADIIGVADPNPIRNERYAVKHKIPAENRFNTWEDVFKRPKFADAVIISTPDNLHYAPCMKALEMGYDVLLEKPIAPTEKECRDILAQARKYNRIVAVCHVLRYSPYFIKVKEMIDSGVLGEIVSMQHLEPVEMTHFLHSYVRGNWHNSKLTTPIILAKSCHDLDIVRWMIGKPCKSVNAMGDLKFFRKENAPKGSGKRCTECAIEEKCPYSAYNEYYRKGKRLYVFDLPEKVEERKPYILSQLNKTNYGVCAFRSDNDQCDHYIANLQFADSVTCALQMEAFTYEGGRRTRIMGTKGELYGDMKNFTFYDFMTRTKTDWQSTAVDLDEFKDAGHGGGDWGLIRDFINAVDKHDEKLLTSTVEASVESHIMGFACEQARLHKKVVDVKL